MPLLFHKEGYASVSRRVEAGVVEHRHPDVRTDSTINAYGENRIIAPFLPAQARLAPATTPRRRPLAFAGVPLLAIESLALVS